MDKEKAKQIMKEIKEECSSHRKCSECAFYMEKDSKGNYNCALDEFCNGYDNEED